jgi:hypothetical protein
MERAGDTELCLDAHDSSLHLIETTGCSPTTVGEPRRSHAVDSVRGLRQCRQITAAWRAVELFVLLTICLSGISWALVNVTQTVNAAYIFGLMWMPAVAAVLTCRVLGRPLTRSGEAGHPTGARLSGSGARQGAAVPRRRTGLRSDLGLVALPDHPGVYRDAGLPPWFWLLTASGCCQSSRR